LAVGDIFLDFFLNAAVNGEQGGHIFHRIIGLEVCGLKGDITVGGGMGFIETVGSDRLVSKEKIMILG
jgi:hypothetical protein